MTGYKNQISVGRARGRKLKIIFYLGRLPGFVGAKKADIQIMPRELEVIRVTAIEGDLLFWRENNPNIGVTLVKVEMISAALPECDHVGTQPRFVERCLFNLGNDLSPGQ